MARRLLSTTAVQSERQIHPVFLKLKETQKMYQKDNGLVIHLKAGTRDKVQNTLQGCLDSIPSPSVKIQIMVGKLA